MTAYRRLLSFGLIVFVMAFVGVWPAAEGRAQTVTHDLAFAGGWTLNKELSDKPRGRGEQDGQDGERGRGDQGGRGGRGGGRRGGGMGGGFGGGGFGGGGNNAPVDREAMARQRDAMNDILNPPDHLVIADTGSLIVLTGPDGRTMRLSPDGKKIKDENTGIERRTKWDGDKLVSEISGMLRGGKATQTFATDVEHHQLHITVEMEGGRSDQKRTITHVYDSDAR